VFSVELNETKCSFSFLFFGQLWSLAMPNRAYMIITRATRCQWLMPIILVTQEAEITIMVWVQLWQIICETPVSKNNQSKMNWRYGSSHSVPALQAQSFEFKPQPHQEKNTTMLKFSTRNLKNTLCRIIHLCSTLLCSKIFYDH
jgi:hypothetical protein